MFKKADSIDKEIGVQKRVTCSAHCGEILTERSLAPAPQNAANKPV